MTYAFIAVRDHRFFKLRVTIPSDEVVGPEHDYLRHIVDMPFPAIRLRSPFEVPKIKVTVYANVFLAPQRESCNVPAGFSTASR